MTARELYDSLTAFFESGGNGNVELEVFEVRSSCSMPVLDLNADRGCISLLVDQADS